MTPASRIQAVLEIWNAIEKGRVPMDLKIGDYMRGRRYIGSKDRASVVERSYDIMRAYGRLSWWLKLLNVEKTPRHLMIAWLALGERMKADEVKGLFDGSQYGPKPLNKDELDLLSKVVGQNLTHKDMPIHTQCECPETYADSLQNYFGDKFEKEMHAFMDGASLDLRVHAGLSDVETVIESLAKDNIEVDKTPYAEYGLRARDKVFLSKAKAFRKGWIEIQDEGSQLIAQVCNAEPKMQVLDYCAGGGGKTLALAAMMQNKGRLVAMDMDERRLEKSRTRFKRAHVHDIIEVRPLSDEKNRKWLRRQKGTFDVVLTDVPCSGTGTWRRNPDSRWFDYGPDLSELLDTQKSILDKVAKVVKPNGILVYATCSILPEENEQQIDWFLQEHPEFEIQSVEKTLTRDNKPFMRLTPHTHQTDGFFAAVLRKKADV